MTDLALSVVRLAPVHADGFLHLFDSAFPDNPDWSGCYCRFYETPEKPWDSSPAASERHRADAAGAIAAGTKTGFLAYAAAGSGATPVGWLNAGPRATFTNPRGYNSDADALVMCFVVAPPWRGRGVAGALLEAALAAFRADGLRTVDAWPAKADPKVAARFPSAAYKGPRSLFDRLGFDVAGGGPQRRVRMRAEL